MDLGIIGTSIWQQNMPLLERLTIDRAEKEKVLQTLKSQLDLDELTYLATCNRVEFIYTTSGRHRDTRLLHRLIDFFFSGQRTISFFPNDFYHFQGKEAITHLFRTTASLESLVLGENQITGQVRQAHEEAMESGLAGPTLDHLIKEALAVARRVKSLTALGDGSLSMASLAANELRGAMASTSDPVIALVGSGPMQAKLAKYIKDGLSAKLVFVNRTVEKAEQLAQEFDGQVVPLDEFTNHPLPVDAIVSATAAIDPIFDAAFLDRLAANGKYVVCVDLAVPRDFSLDFVGDPRVLLIDIPALKRKSQGSLRQKFVEAAKANEIVRQAVVRYLSDRIEVSLKPIFHDTYQENVALARKALDDLFCNRVTSLRPDEKEAVVRIVTKLIGQSTFGPVKRLSQELVENHQIVRLDQSSAVHRKAV